MPGTGHRPTGEEEPRARRPLVAALFTDDDVLEGSQAGGGREPEGILQQRGRVGRAVGARHRVGRVAAVRPSGRSHRPGRGHLADPAAVRRFRLLRNGRSGQAPGRRERARCDQGPPRRPGAPRPQASGMAVSYVRQTARIRHLLARQRHERHLEGPPGLHRAAPRPKPRRTGGPAGAGVRTPTDRPAASRT